MKQLNEMNKKNIKNVLFVCTGNSCRSVMAEGLLKKELAKIGKGDIEVYSAGISTIDGFPPTEKTIAVMKAEGVDVSGYKSERLTLNMIHRSDLILGMESIHVDEVLNLAPHSVDKTYLLKEHTGKKDRASGFAVPDPIGRPLEIYERILEMVKESIEELIKKL